MAQGKIKGNAFEREYAKKISLWLTKDIRNDCIWRTSNSGGKATVTLSDTQCGDLHAVRPEAKKFFDVFSIELKSYKSLNLLDINSKNFVLASWWTQAQEDAKRANRIPLLIFRINRKGDWWATSPTILKELVVDKELLTKDSLLYNNAIHISPVHYDGTITIRPVDVLFKGLILDKFTGE